MIDTHAHLNFKAFNKDLDKVIDRASKAGVEKIIIPGAKIDSSIKAVEIANNYLSCYASVGIHPHHANEINTLIHNSIKVSDIKTQISKLIKNNKVIAIGEIGLDYHQYKDHPQISDEDKNKQKEIFLMQLEIASSGNLPVIIHCRDSQNDLLEILKEFTNKNKISGVFHCFSGNIENLKKVLEMDFYVGFDGNITYPENKNLQTVVCHTPLDRILVETDSPFLTPLPYRGNRNEPSYLQYIIMKMVQIHKKNTSEIAEITSSNAIKLFKL